MGHADPLANGLINVVEGIMNLGRGATGILDMPDDYDTSSMLLNFQREDKIVGRELKALKHSIPMPKCEDTTPLQMRIEMAVTNGVGYDSRIDPQNLHHKFCYDPEDIFCD
ncbi:hypothetical protein FJZ19_00640 [Candidatus Pacearchaeota archaeon]|nr:hypothetical protein [Candidatus Pacearchaeota archaeon]